jgi:rhamnosyltransferase
MPSECIRVAAIVVTYSPDLASLNQLLNALTGQVEAVIVIDNDSCAEARSWLSERCGDRLEVRFLSENQGVAAAQNIGIARARELGAKFVVLFDQDSLPEPDMVARLIEVAEGESAAGRRLAAVGPRYFDVVQRSSRPFVQLRGMRVRRYDCGHAGQLIPVDHLISSGCLIPVAVLDDVGAMCESLFIDYVDTEWCFRAWRKGYALLGVCDARMQHGLGDAPNYFLGRYVPIHKPLRHYYLFRNAIWLFRQRWIPLTWKMAMAHRLLLKFLYFSIIPAGRRAQVGMMLRGLYDGFLNRMGRYRER